MSNCSRIVTQNNENKKEQQKEQKIANANAKFFYFIYNTK